MKKLRLSEKEHSKSLILWIYLLLLRMSGGKSGDHPARLRNGLVANFFESEAEYLCRKAGG